MQRSSKYATIFTLLLAAPAVYGDTLNYTSIEPALNAACVDFPPIGDGFGWNGRCGCMMQPEWEQFGRVVAVSGNTLAIAAADTPENCPGSDATISTYEKSEDGEWLKQTEFQPSPDENYTISKLDFVDGKLHINYRLVFENIDGEWQLASTLDPFVGPFARNAGASSYEQGSQTIIFGERDSDGNETIQNEVQIEGPGWFLNPGGSSFSPFSERGFNIYGDTALFRTRDDLFFFGKNTSGDWQFENRVPFNLVQSAFQFQGSIIALGLADNMHRWVRGSNGVWTKLEVFNTDLPFPVSYLETVPFQSENKILLTTRRHFRTYTLNSENRLVESDRIQLPANFGDQWSGIWGGGDNFSLIKDHIAFSDQHLVAASRSDNIAYVFDVSSNGSFIETEDTTPQGSCDYSNAALYDGWGWNAVTGESCQPQQATQDTACDYSQAESHDGWGWNPVTRTSCAPRLVTQEDTSSECDYSQATVNGGWGWNDSLSESCPPLNSVTNNTCDYSGADINAGWGWNALTGESCPPR